MKISRWLVSYAAVSRREVTRFSKVWLRTLLPPMVNAALYFLIFGNLIGRKLGNVGGLGYAEFMMPGLVLMSAIIASYTNVASSLYTAKFQRYSEEILTAPVPDSAFVMGYVTGGAVRGCLVGILVYSVSLCLVDSPLILVVAHPFGAVAAVFFASVLFSLAGFINAAYAKNFDDIAVIPTLLLTPLIYLGGVFYSLEMLPPFWQKVSLANPILYIIDVSREAFFDRSETPVYISCAVMAFFAAALYTWAMRIVKKGSGLRN